MKAVGLACKALGATLLSLLAFSALAQTKLYFHDAATPNLGTMPGPTTLSATTPDVTALGAGINRDMDGAIGTAQTSAALTTLPVTTQQRNWFRRFVSGPLAAQTLPTGAWTIQGGASESAGASNMLVWGTVIKVWRPSTGAVVATLLDNPVLGATEPGTAQTNIATATPPITGIAVNEGDVLVVELWARNNQQNTQVRINTIYYDGTTEGSVTSNAAFLQAPGPIAFHRSVRQSGYRFFDNTDSADVGAPLGASDAPVVLGSTGTAFRLRMLLHVADVALGVAGQDFKLQFVGKGTGTCAAPTGGVPAAWTDVTGATAIAFNDNATPADGASLTANAFDPTHGGDTVINQTYEEANNFTNSVPITRGADGKWDFALRDNGAPATTTYCLRAVKSNGAALDTYYVFPEVTTAAGIVAPGSFNAFETSTPPGAVSGPIRTKIAGIGFSLDVVAVLAGAQFNAFTGAVTVELLANNTLGVALDANNCPVSSTLLQTVSPNPTINAGRSTVTFVPVVDSWRDVRVRVRYPASLPTVTSCSTDNFAIRPNTLVNLAVRDSDWQTADPAGTGRNLDDLSFTAPPAGKVHKAGRPFTVRATAVNAAGAPAVTANYAGTPTPALTSCGGAGAACTPSVGTLTLGGAFSAGVLDANGATYNNVGAFALQLIDDNFASVDSTDTSGDCTASGRYVCSSVVNVGRFVPDHFAVSLNTPAFAPACGSFTYLGQVFRYGIAPQITVTAQDFANNTTTLYAANWWRITNTSLMPAGQVSRYSAASGTLDTSLLPPTTTDPAIDSTVPGGGVGTLIFAGSAIGSGLSFVRPTDPAGSPAAPAAPFDADISLLVDIIDADGVAYASNPVRFGQATAGNGMSFSGGNKQVRFGRLRLDNAVGSERMDLPIPIQTQYWNGTTFITNGADNCTSISTANVGFSNYFGGITATNMNSSNVTGLGANFSSGFGSLTLTKPTPTPASPGAVTLTVNLTAEGKSYLKGNWGVPTYSADPSSRAAFGLYGGQPNNFIYFRENY